MYVVIGAYETIIIILNGMIPSTKLMSTPIYTVTKEHAQIDHELSVHLYQNFLTKSLSMHYWMMYLVMALIQKYPSLSILSADRPSSSHIKKAEKYKECILMAS